jgi:hypothetical protein
MNRLSLSRSPEPRHTSRGSTSCPVITTSFIVRFLDVCWSGCLCCAVGRVRLSQDDTEPESSADEVSLLFVQNADGANLDGDSLTMVEVNPTIGWFSHRPAREAGPMATAAATPACLTVAAGPAGCLSILTPRAKPCSAAFSPRSCRSSCPRSEQLVSQESHRLASTAAHYSATLKAIALLPGLLLEPGVRIELTTS